MAQGVKRQSTGSRRTVSYSYALESETGLLGILQALSEPWEVLWNAETGGGSHS